MKNTIKKLITGAVLTLLLASNAFAAKITDITHTQLKGDRLQIMIKGDGALPKPLSFSINDPARIVLDFKDTQLALKAESLSINSGKVTSIKTIAHKNRSRLVINLVEATQYRVVEAENGINVLIDSGSVAATKGPSAALGQKYNTIQSVDFRKGPQGEGRVVIKLSDPSAPVNVQQQGNRIIAEFFNSSIDADLVQRLDVIDFSTPAKYIDITQSGNKVRLAVTPMHPNFSHMAYQSNEMFTLELKPIAKEEQERLNRKKFGYTGERLSLNFQDVEVRSVLQMLAEFTQKNVVVSDKVQGSLTLRLKNVPWDQALDIILKTKNLAKRESGNVLLIAPAEDIAQQEKIALEARKQAKELAPIRSEFVRVNYAKAAEIATILSNESASILTSRGGVTIDPRTNTLLITDTGEAIEDALRVIKRLDVPVTQVLIEARIVIANEDFDHQLGAKFGVNSTSTGALTDGVTQGDVTGGSLNATTQNINGQTLDGNDRLNFNMPVPRAGAGRLGLALARLPSGSLVELELSALQAEGNGEIVSTPRVITANQKEAYIEQGVEIAYQEASASGATAVAFKQAVLKLTVTPQVTPDNNVILDLNVKQDSVGDIYLNIPSINTREIETQVLVNNGETIVLGGIFQYEKANVVSKVPFFGDLPLLGRLFRNTTKSENKRELLIFVTPKIIKDSMQFN